MENHGHEVFISFIAITLVLVLLFVFLLSLVFLFQRRQAQYRAEKQALHEAYQREILQAQVETQNQTLQHIGGELHDHIGQLLSVAVLQLNILDEELEQSPHQVNVQQTGSLVDQVLQDLRALSKTLNPDAVSKLGLQDSISLELERISRTGRYLTNLTITGEARALDPQVGIVLFRMVQEIISNTLKHARAKKIDIQMAYYTSKLTIRVTDDGRGFSTASVNIDKSANGQGMSNLYRRAGLLGGSCQVVSKPGEGCVVEIDLPIY